MHAELMQLTEGGVGMTMYHQRPPHAYLLLPMLFASFRMIHFNLIQ